ncbi:MAG: VOC family protein [Fimbriiglobus sp.]
MFAAPPMANLLVIRSPDIHRATRFYRELGLLITLHRHGNGPEHYASSVNGFVFEIYPLTSRDHPTTSVRLGFNVDSVDGIVEMLRAIQVEIISEPHDSEWGRRAVVRDFDGHTVELLTPPNRDMSPCHE